MKKGFLERLAAGENVVVAEGYIFEFERRGYLQAGAFVPEIILEKPELVRAMHEEFVHAGSDVVLAFTYYGHREKLRTINREDDLEKLNVAALKIAREVADKTGTLMAGNLCNTAVYIPENEESIKKAENMFKEQIEWAVEYGADFIVGETFGELGEAMLALQCIKKYGKGLPAVITMTPSGACDCTTDGVPFPEALRKLEEAGAAVVGLNCFQGPNIMIPLIKKIKNECKGPIAAMPVPYRTTEKEPTFYSLTDGQGHKLFPFDLPCCMCSRTDIVQFAKEAKDLGIQYVGLCCGNAAHYMRIVAEVYGRRPPASKFSPDMSKHYLLGDKDKFDKYFTSQFQDN